ncbi:OOP family OmpA-OmpF porin [Azomonas agilis]|uniref:OOP family OmpA-OmpF porin n=1 Tax=Azomonas agilis TaxID=116849 RepID=A0A562J160_9GAMM|nr:OmpA family protein [Azomonas agilis]TWH76863.1 OOP family OmpA-OmpF porin [Azomonas agilis]
MKLKTTLGVLVGSLVAGASLSAFAQGQGAFEVEAFSKYYQPQGSRDLEDGGGLFGASASYFLTDDVSLGISHGVYRDLNSNHPIDNGSHKDIKGSLTSVDAVYHFGQPGAGLRPYVSAGLAYQTIGQADRSGRDKSTLVTAGTGLKYYFTDMLFAKAGVDGTYNIDDGYSEWMGGIGIGMNFGGSGRKVAAAPAPEPVMAAAAVAEPPQEPMAEVVRVELDVKFDFDKAVVRRESYRDIEDLANFMKQYPTTTTVVEGHTDSVGTDQYNQRLSERRAQAVRRVLVDQYGVASNRVDSVGYGESRPVADNATEAGRQINRRVEAEVEAQIK